MAAIFWWDQRSPNANPPSGSVKRAVQGLAGKFNEFTADTPQRPSITKFPGLNRDRVLIGPSHCLFMSGTTSELQAALDSNAGTLESLSLLDDRIDVRFVRRKVPTGLVQHETETVIGIGGFKGYWNEAVRLDKKQAKSRNDWAKLELIPATEKIFVRDKGEYRNAYCAFLPLQVLRDRLVHQCKGVSAWA